MSGSAAHDTAAGDSRRALLLLAVFGLAWVVLETVVGARLQGHYDLLQVVWSRYATHLLALLLVFGWRHPRRLWQTQRPGFHLARSILMLVMPVSFMLSLRLGASASTVWAIFWTAPLMVIGIARAVSGERVGSATWAAGGVGMVAAFATFAPPPPVSLWQLVMPLAMAASFAMYLPMTRSLREEPVTTNLFYTALGVFAALTPCVPFVWVTPSGHDAIVFAAIGLLGLGTLFVLDRACALAPVGGLAPALYLHLAFLVPIQAALHGGGVPAPALSGIALSAGIAAFLWWQLRDSAPLVSATAANVSSRSSP